MGQIPPVVSEARVDATGPPAGAVLDPVGAFGNCDQAPSFTPEKTAAGLQ
jgi:hypothetical protein